MVRNEGVVLSATWPSRMDDAGEATGTDAGVIEADVAEAGRVPTNRNLLTAIAENTVSQKATSAGPPRCATAFTSRRPASPASARILPVGHRRN
ncbi:hypothetical protein ACLQ3B_05585 [Micromonospora sp. DT53]|uniref:hypothetical protein n=1 Tax=Micromonospora sp. DT53 TaxID=3393444 RepID=UPI003CF1B722